MSNVFNPKLYELTDNKLDDLPQLVDLSLKFVSNLYDNSITTINIIKVSSIPLFSLGVKLVSKKSNEWTIRELCLMRGKHFRYEISLIMKGPN